MDKKVIFYIIIGLLTLGLLLLNLFPGWFQVWKDSGKSIEDKCKAPPEYTEESWREHMSHHPNIYGECLG